MPTHDDPPLLFDGQDVSEFSRRHGLELLRFAYLLCGDRHRAEDLLQDVMLAMYRRFPGELPLDNPVGYARRALANANISWAHQAQEDPVVAAASELGASAAAAAGWLLRSASWKAAATGELVLARLPLPAVCCARRRGNAAAAG